MARAILKKPELARDYQVRWIGLDEKTTVQIIQFIKLGKKSNFHVAMVERAEQLVRWVPWNAHNTLVDEWRSNVGGADN